MTQGGGNARQHRAVLAKTGRRASIVHSTSARDAPPAVARRTVLSDHVATLRGDAVCAAGGKRVKSLLQQNQENDAKEPIVSEEVLWKAVEVLRGSMDVTDY